MIHIVYSLYTAEGRPLDEERPRSEHVPRVGELLSFGASSYQVLDVLWHLDGTEPWVTVTAHELNWHRHIDVVTTAWTAAHR